MLNTVIKPKLHLLKSSLNVGLLGGVFLGLLSGCGDMSGMMCNRGQTQGCACSDGRSGSRTCGVDGTFGQCICQADAGFVQDGSDGSSTMSGMDVMMSRPDSTVNPGPDSTVNPGPDSTVGPGPDATMSGPDATTCVPRCSGAVCGDNGCGGSCGTCGQGFDCVGGQCEIGPGTWVMTITSGMIDSETPSGSAWDVFGGNPDPQICVTIAGTERCSAEVMDSFTPSWNFALPATTGTTLQSGVGYQLLDIDVAADDTICSGTIRVTPQQFAQGRGTVTCTSASFNFTLVPR